MDVGSNLREGGGQNPDPPPSHTHTHTHTIILEDGQKNENGAVFWGRLDPT
jgi:hypothetical protein